MTTPSAPDNTQDAEHLRLLSIFHYVVAAMTALFASFPIIHLVVGAAMVFLPGRFGDSKGGEPPVMVGIFFMAFAGAWIVVGWTLAICMVIAGRKLAQRKRYLFCLVVAGFTAVSCMPFGTVLGIFTILVLVRPSMKQAFGAGAVIPA